MTDRERLDRMNAEIARRMFRACQNPYCDGTGWVLVDATAASNAYRTPACRDEAHRNG